jgi:phage baseplate assembly protein V
VFRVGLVKQLDPQNARVRVAFPDHDQMLSYWLPIVVSKTQNDKGYWIPDLDEQVVCLMDEHDEAGAVLGAIYSTADTPPTDPNTGQALANADVAQHTFKDGATFQYNRATHVGLAQLPDKAVLKYDAEAHAFTLALPSGATMSVTANGASISIDGTGNVKVVPGDGAQVQLGSAGGVKGVARLGDMVQVTDDEGGILNGTIVSASADVVAN